jgi:ABC-type polar amino acid transport system ATPase subunit
MGLAPLVVEKIFEVIRSVAAEGVTILLVEQNANLALEFSQRAYNTIARSNRLELSALDAFAHDLQAWFSTGARIAPLDSAAGAGAA